MLIRYFHISSEKWAYEPVFTFAVTTTGSSVDRNILKLVTTHKFPLGLADTLWVTRPFRLVKGERLPKLLEK